MSACCIGGVCIPYTAIFPFLAYCFKWLYNYFQGLFSKEEKKTAACSTGCCGAGDAAAGPSRVQELETQEDYDKMISSGKVVFVKFTASWCRPCKEIQPVYEKISAQHNKAMFAKADADELDDAASACQISILPTFCVFHKRKLIDKYVGSNENKLQEWVGEVKEAVSF